MTLDAYNATVRQRFSEARYAGRPDSAPGWTEVLAAEGGDGCRIRLAACVEDGRIERLRYRVYGCPHLVAAVDLVCEQLQGGNAAALRAVSVSELQEELGVPVSKTNRLLLLEDALRELAGKCDAAT